MCVLWLAQGMDLKGFNIYATTAANARESSWGTYCPGQSPAPPPEFSTCLGDLYSVAFLEDDDAADRRHETLQEQFERVKYRTSNNGTYMQVGAERNSTAQLHRRRILLPSTAAWRLISAVQLSSQLFGCICSRWAASPAV